MRRFAWALLVLSACIEADGLGRCADVLCPARTGCWTGDGAPQCVPASALEACEGRATGEACGVNSSCHEGACFVVTCGDGWLDTGEVCDDGNRVAADGCSLDCQSNETCGNGAVDAAVGEACDDGNLDAGDGCQPTCSLARCGDGFPDPVEECDEGAANSDAPNASCRTNCQAARCGDSVTDASEVCDDGNQSSGDGCSFDCQSNETCGNGVIDFFAGETCDDAANHIGHDNCIDSCVAETPLWGELLTQIPAQNRVHMVFDPDRNVMVLLGGSNDGTDRMTTWEYDGTGWRENRSLVRPTARGRSAMAYDPVRKRVVVFGGSRPNATRTNETWEYDGVTWELKTPTVSPPPRERHAMAFDATRGVIVLFGGASATDFLGDTWEYDGTTWTQGPDGPSARSLHGMAFNGTHIVMFGGGGATLLDDTWVYDGAWSPVVTSGTPSARRFHRMSYDGTSVVMFGGDAGSGALNETWVLQGTSWSALTSTQIPAARTEYALAYDSVRDRVVMFGGTVNGVGVRDTWELSSGQWSPVTLDLQPTGIGPIAYDTRRGRTVAQAIDGSTWEHDGHTWTQRTLTPNPSWRVGASMVYDSKRGVMILFGGEYGGYKNDTWEYDGEAWTERTFSIKPSPRNEHMVTYDERAGRMILFGAFGLSDTWEYDGVVWTARTFASNARPASRYRAAFAYDPVRGRSVLFGGSPSGALVAGDTWEYDAIGMAWTQMTPAAAPMERQLAISVFDSVRSRVVLHGGRGVAQFADTWEWDGVQWTQITTPFTPNDPIHRMSYDRLRGRILALSATNLTFTLERRAPASYDSCNGAEDADGDGLLGCADPDCRGYCDPVCPANSMSCDVDRPRCGDGVCNAFLEHSARCPADCP